MQIVCLLGTDDALNLVVASVTFAMDVPFNDHAFCKSRFAWGMESDFLADALELARPTKDKPLYRVDYRALCCLLRGKTKSHRPAYDLESARAGITEPRHPRDVVQNRERIWAVTIRPLIAIATGIAGVARPAGELSKSTWGTIDIILPGSPPTVAAGVPPARNRKMAPSSARLRRSGPTCLSGFAGREAPAFHACRVALPSAHRVPKAIHVSIFRGLAEPLVTGLRFVYVASTGDTKEKEMVQAVEEVRIGDVMPQWKTCLSWPTRPSAEGGDQLKHFYGFQLALAWIVIHGLAILTSLEGPMELRWAGRDTPHKKMGHAQLSLKGQQINHIVAELDVSPFH